MSAFRISWSFLADGGGVLTLKIRAASLQSRPLHFIESNFHLDPSTNETIHLLEREKGRHLTQELLSNAVGERGTKWLQS